jgi:hypothetical protein
MKITQFVKNLVAKLQPDVLAGALPYPNRLDYAEKLIQEAFDAHTAEMLKLWREDFGEISAERAAWQQQVQGFLPLLMKLPATRERDALVDYLKVLSRYGEEQPLRCEIVNGQLLISAGVNAVRDGLQAGWEYFGHQNKVFTISNAAGFAADMKRALQREDEQGASLLSDMLDEAADHAINSGSEWVTRKEH